ncbi:hypothetical protein [Daejeonella sp. H1SJ63]|uniref:hypothetical protein n=1 Tax=Daejeonella sp. H1SJ63 TaxID=3034145 RepID=UPI0023EC4185|nr:hypothetical protein [Daejeonella sp. H1SJ63]
MRIYLLIFVFLASAVQVRADKALTIICSPGEATIYKVGADKKEINIGTGTAVIKIDKDEPVTIVVRLDGYKPVSKTYVNSKSVPLPKEDRIVLDTRLVRVSAQPYDAKIYIEGAVQPSNTAWVEVKKDATVTVEVKKPGFFTKHKIYQNRTGMEVPPIDDAIALTDRSMFVKTVPSDVQVIVNGKNIGEGNSEVVIPVQTCVTVQYVKEGFVTVEKQYCAKDGQPLPPLTENIILKDRIVAVRTTPEDASIKIDGRVMGNGEYKVRIPAGQCVEVIVEKAGFVPSKKNFCNEDGVQPPPVSEHVILAVDEAFTSSVQSDQANVNFTIETGKLEEDAWKILSQITMNYFDNIELADRETGYIRTSWNVKNFLNNTIRTRIIVKQADIMPLKYTIKLISEYSGKAKTSVKEDESFQSWDRILNTYKDVISEYQSRLR